MSAFADLQEACRSECERTGMTAMEWFDAELARKMPGAVIEAHERREARAVAAEADRIAANPMLLDGINCLFASSKPRTIIAVCEALLEEPGAVGTLRLKGAIAYARQQMQVAA